MTDPDEDDGPAFPLGVWIAGVVWVFFGGLGILGAATSLIVPLLAQTGEQVGGFGACCFGVIAVGFMVVGVTTIRGGAADTLANGSGSVGISLFGFGIAGLVTYAELSGPGGARAWVLLTVALPFAGFGFLLLLAGVLALAGRSRYKAWREARIRPGDVTDGESCEERR